MYPQSQHLLTLTPKAKPSAQLHAIPNGPAGTLATLKIMWLLAKRGRVFVRPLSLHLVKHLQQKDFMGEITALHDFVRDKIRYVKDIDGIETVHPVEWILHYGQGDCDDKAVLLAAMLESIGHPSRLVAVGARHGHYSHVFVQTLVGKKYITLETTEPMEAGQDHGRKFPAMMIYPPMGR